MTRYKYILLTLFALGMAGMATAQTNGSNSPYSRFGLGLLNERSLGFNRGMGGVGIGMKAGNRINAQNPASLGAIDSLTFLFDVGMSVQQVRMDGKAMSLKTNNTTLDYVQAAFRLRPGLGMSIGFMPYTTIGYSFSESQSVGANFTTGEKILSTSTYYGDGGLHQATVGVGWQARPRLSIGMNVSYIWGRYNHQVVQRYTEGGAVSSTYNGLNKHFDTSLKTYKLDLGVQYDIPLNEKDELTVGATYGLGHKINSTAHLYRFTSNGDSIHLATPKAFELPHTFGLGISYRHTDKWLVGVDALHERWGDCAMPIERSSNNRISYDALKGAYQNRTRVAVGMEYTPSSQSRRYFNRIHYRLGGSFATPYAKVNGEDGPNHFSLSAGLGLPISNFWSNRSVVNISFQWERVQPAQSLSMITEDYFKINVGITFNERWFMKWKIR